MVAGPSNCRISDLSDMGAYRSFVAGPFAKNFPALEAYDGESRGGTRRQAPAHHPCHEHDIAWADQPVDGDEDRQVRE
jgi:hypothetical protein